MQWNNKSLPLLRTPCFNCLDLLELVQPSSHSDLWINSYEFCVRFTFTCGYLYNTVTRLGPHNSEGVKGPSRCVNCTYSFNTTKVNLMKEASSTRTNLPLILYGPITIYFPFNLPVSMRQIDTARICMLNAYKYNLDLDLSIPRTNTFGSHMKYTIQNY